jgi:5-formyltetrahydrofolate cyclo-ligase
VLLYFALPDELDVSALAGDALKAGKTVALPRYDPERDLYLAAAILDPVRDCLGGRFGILEPGADCAILPLNQLDLVLVPGVAFYRCGYRLGRGKGFYDRLLEPVRGIKCGVAWDHQVDLEFPVEPHDVPMDCIVTPAIWRSFGTGPVLR